MTLPSGFRSARLDSRTSAWIVGVVAALVYASSLGNGFAYDDMPIIVGNADIQSVETLSGAIVSPYWPGEYGRQLGLWRPTTTGMLGVQWIVGDGSPLLFHAVNVAGHALTTVLVFLLFVHLMPLLGALAAGLVFAVHPVHVEAVANVIGLAEVISTAAIVGAALVHVRGSEVTGWARALSVAALYAIAFGAKESAVTLPGVVFLLDAARGRLGVGDVPEYVARRWRLYLAMGAVAGGLLLTRFAILGSIADPLAPLGADLLREVPRIWTLGEIWTHYVRLWILPLDLSADYSPNVIPISTSWHLSNTLGVVLALTLLLGALASWRGPALTPGRASSRVAGFAIAWFVITISPISNTLFLSGVLLAERTLYLPSVGLAAGVGWLVVRLAEERRRAAWALLAVFVLFSAYRTWTRSPTWRDTSTVMATMIEEHPHSGRSQWVLGDAFLRQGREPEAMRAYRAAIGLLGTHYQVTTEIARKLYQIERYRAAEALARIAADNEPQFPLAPGMIALIRAEWGDAVETELWARRSLALSEVDPTRHQLLAWALASQGRLEEAAAARERGLEHGEIIMWQQSVYEAYLARAQGDSVAMRAMVDSAWSRVSSRPGRLTLDSVSVADFGARSRLTPAEVAESSRLR